MSEAVYFKRVRYFEVGAAKLELIEALLISLREASWVVVLLIGTAEFKIVGVVLRFEVAFV